MIFHATKSKVLNRGTPPDAFLSELVSWGRIAPDEIFAINSEARDIYTSIKPVLGPWIGTPLSREWFLHRKAVMLEVLRVLAGFESSWNWREGVDTTNPTSNTPETMEAGAWQVSANSIAFGDDLRELVMDKVGTLDGTEFQKAMKSNRTLAMEYASRLLRHTTHHNGPAKRHEIDEWLRRDAVNEFMELVSTSPSHPELA